MKENELMNALSQLICENFTTDRQNKIDASTSLLSLGIDSVGMMSMFVLMEEAFHITIDEEDMFNELANMGQLVKFVEQKMKES